MTEYEWEAVCSLWGIRFTAAQRAAGSPDAFEPYQLAIMQRPVIPTSSTRVAEIKRQRDFLAKIDAAVTAGTLHASTKTRMVPTTKTVTVEDYAAPRSAWVTDWGFSSRPPMVTKTVKTGERQEEYKVIDRSAFRDWLNARGEPPSVHIQAWLGSPQAAPKPTARDTKPPKKMDFFLSLLEQVEVAWRDSGRGEIDRHEWPGTSRDLCVLAGQLMPHQFYEMSPESFYSSYPKKAGVLFRKEKGVSAIYAELFPHDGPAARQRNAA